MIPIKDKGLQGTTFIDLFSGLGGFHLALSSLGSKCVFASEINERARKVYTSNFNLIPHGDITKINPNDIPNHDILCAGFPCQTFSISGNQKGFNDTRGTLFFNIATIIKAKRPKVVFLENVRNLATHDKGKTIKVIKDIILGLGYSFYMQVFSGTDFNIPQDRKRVYIVAFRDHKDFEFPNKLEMNSTVYDILETGIPVGSPLWKDVQISYLDKGVEEIDPTRPLRIGTVKGSKGGQGYRIYSPLGAAITLSASGGGLFAKTGGYLIEGRTRRLSPRECARLQGFPDSYQLDDSDNVSYTQLGNSVIVDILQHIGIKISDTLKKTSQ